VIKKANYGGKTNIKECCGGSVTKTFQRTKTKGSHDIDGMSDLTMLEQNCCGFTLVSLLS